jgi:hypothetical protein
MTCSAFLTRVSQVKPPPMLGLAPAPNRGELPWAAYRWVATIDERVLWATLAAALLMVLWGAFVGWRSRGRDETRN